MIATTLTAVLESYAPLISLLGAIIGALLGVVASQILSLYRDDLDAERELEGLTRQIELATADHLSGKKRTEKVREIEGDLADIYTKKSWLLDDEGLQKLERQLSVMQRPHSYKPDDDDAYVRSHDGEGLASVKSELNDCKDIIEEHRRKVRLRRSWRRYFGLKNPY